MSARRHPSRLWHSRGKSTNAPGDEGKDSLTSEDSEGQVPNGSEPEDETQPDQERMKPAHDTEGTEGWDQSRRKADDQRPPWQSGMHGREQGTRSAIRSHWLGNVDHRCVELCPICRAADLIRAIEPPELQEQWGNWQREVLVALKKLIDHYVDHLEHESAPTTSVEDIPID